MIVEKVRGFEGEKGENEKVRKWENERGRR